MITVFNIFAYLRDMGHLETLIIVIFPCQFTKRNMGILPVCFKGYGILIPPIQAS